MGAHMNRREFVATTVAGAAGLSTLDGLRPGGARLAASDQQSVRSFFPRAEASVFVNGAGGTPLASFAEAGIQRYLDFIRLGPEDGRGEYVNEALSGVRPRFADLIGANVSEIGFVECTKEGEQIVIDGISARRPGSNIVTNDLHFSGSLHNLEGLRRSGRDVRVVRARDFDVSLDQMADAIDDDTGIVTVSLVSNVNGRIEAMAELAEVAHAHGALVFADIIQAVGTVPVDVKAMGIDVAATSSYKWLFGIHGAGFLYVSDEVQGEVLPDFVFPGHVVRNYAPFRTELDPAQADLVYTAPSDARRYQPGHVSYLGYCAAYEGLGFIADVGVPTIQRHAARLNARILDQLDRDRFELMSTHTDESAILALAARDFDGLRERLIASDVVVSIGGDRWNQVRISPAIYNTEADVDRVVEVLNG